jgi:hypothetical protein
MSVSGLIANSDLRPRTTTFRAVNIAEAVEQANAFIDTTSTDNPLAVFLDVMATAGGGGNTDCEIVWGDITDGALDTPYPLLSSVVIVGFEAVDGPGIDEQVLASVTANPTLAAYAWGYGTGSAAGKVVCTIAYCSIPGGDLGFDELVDNAVLPGDEPPDEGHDIPFGGDA